MKLKVDVKDVNSCEKILTIDVPSDVVSEEFSSFYESVGKRARIPGFRPGHAPKHVVALHYREEARREVFKQLVPRTLREAVRQEEIPIIGYPRVEDVEFDEMRLKFKAHVETKPKIRIEKYVGLSVTRDAVQVGEAEVEEVLKRIQESRAKFQAVEGREAKLGDFLICDYRLEVGGKEIEKRTSEQIEIREQDYLQGFSKQLIGAKAGEARQVMISFPSDYAHKELAGREGRFDIMIHEIKEKKLLPLDDEFAKEAGDYETLDELKKAIRSDLENHKRREAETRVDHALLDELIRKSKFEIPQGMVERRLQALIEDSVQSLIYRGVKKEDAVSQRDALRKDLAPRAEREVRISFLLAEIAQREHIEATEEDLNQKFQRFADELHRPLEEVKAYYTQQEERKESLLLQIVSEKTIEWIKAKAIISELSERK